MFFNSYFFFVCVCDKEIIDTIKVTHKNLLNEAANLKNAHESVDVRYLSINRI